MNPNKYAIVMTIITLMLGFLIGLMHQGILVFK